jgi:voltage-gated potassium channel Kch
MNTQAKLPYRRWHFLQLLLVMATWMLVSPHLPNRWLAQAVLQVFLLNAVLVTLWSNSDWLRFRGRILALWAVSLAGSLIELAPLPQRWTLAAHTVATLSLLPVIALVSTGILLHVYRSSRLTLDGIFATMVVYVLVALIFARVYVLLIGLEPQSFDLPVPAAERTPHLLRVDMLYFSLVTLATVGYGDILPVGGTARMLAMIEAVVGQFYIAVVVAVFVGMYSAQQRK